MIRINMHVSKNKITRKLTDGEEKVSNSRAMKMGAVRGENAGISVQELYWKQLVIGADCRTGF